MHYATVAVAMLAAFGLVAACGSSGGSGGPTSAATATGANSGGPAASTGPGATAEPIKVGVVCTCSGTYGGEISVAGDVVQAWAKQTSASGGIDGHPIDLVFYDDKSNPGDSVTAAKKLISAHVDVVVELSILTSTWADAVSSAGIPVVSVGSTAPSYTDPNFYPVGQTNDSIVYSLMATAELAGAKNLGVFYCTESPQCQETLPLLDDAGKKFGIPVKYSSAISFNAPNYTAQCVAAKQAGISAVFVADTAPVFYRVGPDCARQGYNPIFIGEGQQFTMKEGTTEGMKDRLWLQFTNLPFFAADHAAIKKLNALEDKYYPGMRNSTEYSELAVQAWAELMLVEAVVDDLPQGQEVTAEAMKSGLDSVTNETLGGLSPPLTFAAGEPHSVSCWLTARVQDGKPELANGGKYTCQDDAAS